MSRDSIVETLLDRYGTTYADELGIDVRGQTPSALFRLLCASLLYSARISSGIATEAMRGMTRAGWRTSRALARSSWEERVRVLNHAGYARYQERTATLLGNLAGAVEERYRGDLRRLRERAHRTPREERRCLQEFDGIGPTGVDIFFREVQVAWDEVRPFADRRSLEAAKRLKLGSSAAELQDLVGPRRLPLLVVALVRARLDGADRELAKAD
jgi:hypothetical protein